MALGVCMKGLNALYYGSHVDFIFEFLPQIILLLALFGFMDLLIIVKWLTNFSVLTDGKPPSVIAMMISMGLNFGEPGEAKPETPLFDHQTLIMKILLITVLVCVPLMLYVKPIWEYRKIKKEHHGDVRVRDDTH